MWVARRMNNHFTYEFYPWIFDRFARLDIAQLERRGNGIAGRQGNWSKSVHVHFKRSVCQVMFHWWGLEGSSRTLEAEAKNQACVLHYKFALPSLIHPHTVYYSLRSPLMLRQIGYYNNNEPSSSSLLLSSSLSLRANFNFWEQISFFLNLIED